MSSRRQARSVVVGLAVVGLTLASWLPAPLPGRTAPQPAPKTIARKIPVALRARSATLCAPINFTAMAITWDQRGRGSVHARVRVGPAISGFRPPMEVESIPGEGPDVTSAEYEGSRQGTDLLWVGNGRCARFTLELPEGVKVRNVRAVFINSSGTAWSKPQPEEPVPPPSGEPAAPAFGLFGAEPAEALTKKPSIIRRSDWGANENLRNCGPDYASRIRIAFVHHTAGTNSYSQSQSDDIVRGIYWYHTQDRGYCDIAYNFLVDKYGQKFEGRYGGMSKPVIPAATMGFNSGSTAISALGNFETASPRSDMVRAISRVLAWRMDVAHVDPTASVTLTSSGSTGGKYPAGTKVTFRTISSHRDAGYTACPGKNLYGKVPGIRTSAYSIGLPKIFSPKQSRGSFTPVQASVTFKAEGSSTLSWRLSVVKSGTVIRSWTATGSHFSKTWNGTGTDGKRVPAGTYAVVLKGTKDGKLARPAKFKVTVR